MPPTPPHARPPNPYIRLFRTPGARAFTLGNLVARLPMGMFSVSAVIMIAGARGSYALAGAVTATGLAATALVAPWTARLVDRHGQARIAVPATAVAVCGSLALLLCVRFGAPDWTLFAAYAATATTPNTGGMSRARWAHLHRVIRPPCTPPTPSSRPPTSSASWPARSPPPSSARPCSPRPAPSSGRSC